VFSDEVKNIFGHASSASENAADPGSSSPYYVCRRLLQLQDPPHQQPAGTATTSQEHQQDVIRFANLSSYAVVYNLALCYHLRGIWSSSSFSSRRRTAGRRPTTTTTTTTRLATRRKKGKKTSLQQAIVLYRCARNIPKVSLRDDEQEFFDDRSISTQELILFNNICHAKHDQQLRSLGGDDPEPARRHYMPQEEFFDAVMIALMEQNHQLGSSSSNYRNHQQYQHCEHERLLDEILGNIAAGLVGPTSAAPVA
jgi:hypothetical protein